MRFSLLRLSVAKKKTKPDWEHSGPEKGRRKFIEGGIVDAAATPGAQAPALTLTCSPLAFAIQKMLRGLPTQLHEELIGSLRLVKSGDLVTYGTVFSCSEIATHVSRQLRNFFQSEHSIYLTIEAQFHTETHQARQTH